MRISDWSSDVCSSDLQHQSRLVLRQNINAVQLAQGHAQGEFMGGCVGGPLVCRDIRGIDGAVERLPISRLARCMIAQAKRLLHLLRLERHRQGGGGRLAVKKAGPAYCPRTRRWCGHESRTEKRSGGKAC